MGSGAEDDELRITVVATGSIAVLALPQYLLSLQSEMSARVRLILTLPAQEFIPLRVAELFAEAAVSDDDLWSRDLSHIALAEWTRVALVLPATAASIGDLANGCGHGLAAAFAHAYRGPLLLFPNMSASMWASPALQRNVATLRADGRIVIDPAHGTAYEAMNRTFGQGAIIPRPEDVLREVGRAAQFNAG